jgi:hypothetical protein
LPRRDQAGDLPLAIVPAPAPHAPDCDAEFGGIALGRSLEPAVAPVDGWPTIAAGMGAPVSRGIASSSRRDGQSAFAAALHQRDLKHFR